VIVRNFACGENYFVSGFYVIEYVVLTFIFSGYRRTSLVPTGQAIPAPSGSNYATHNGLETQPELTIAYALPPRQAPGYLVHGEVAGM
jgi:hypothetical protein